MVNHPRPTRSEAGHSNHDHSADSAIMVTSAVRPTDPGIKHHHSNPDERISLFWRVFGGTILMIAALVVITLYNSQASAIAELRAEVNRLNEARGESIKKEEFNSRTQSMWERMQQLQEMRVTVTGLKEQMNGIGEKTGDLKAIQEKLTLLDQRLKMAEEDHKALAKAELAITALEQKSAARDTMVKASEDERKEMAKQLQELRERLAKVEGATETKPMPKTAAAKDRAN